MFNIKKTTLIKIGITVHSSRRFSEIVYYLKINTHGKWMVAVRIISPLVIFPRNTKIPVFLGVSDSCVYLASSYVAVFPNLSVICHQHINDMSFLTSAVSV
jgi:hypothetical protein